MLGAKDKATLHLKACSTDISVLTRKQGTKTAIRKKVMEAMKVSPIARSFQAFSSISPCNLRQKYPKIGPKKAHFYLSEWDTEWELFYACKLLYEAAYGDDWREELLEQAYLLWMVRGRDEEGRLIMWEIPNEDR